MQLFGQDIKFWIVVGGATVFKIMTSKNMSPTRVVVTIVAAVLSAWAFTGAVLDLFSLNPDTYLIPVAALLALTGESFMRWVIELTPEKAADFARKLRGK